MNRRNAVVAAVVGCMALMGFTLITPRYDLSDEQRTRLNTESRLGGGSGLGKFINVVKYPDGIGSAMFEPEGRKLEDVPPVKLGDSFSSGASLEGVAFELGMPSRTDGVEMGDYENFVPEVRDDGLYVTYTSSFINLMNESTKEMVFRNVDDTLFGANGYVSAEEMQRFFEDDRTEVVSYECNSEDMLTGTCSVKLRLDGNTLITDAVNDCPRRIKSSDIDGLIGDLVKMWR